ncbi:hypothetical protein GQ53DRAFT_755932 [Thozetella sp. PMI_491]|nr:hypothetical protein GQ53DRAFT_755932 [Thozetella sp. PMI_491]
MTNNSQLAPCRLLVTTHAKDGTSVFVSDDKVDPFVLPFGPLPPSFSIFHASNSVPVSNNSTPATQPKALPRCPETGVIFCTTDIQPGGSAPMHRTESVDYVVVVAGEIVMRLDSGEEKTLRAGDYMVQRGTNHAMHNRSDRVCRMAVVMVGASKVVLADGTELEETKLGPPPAR